MVKAPKRSSDPSPYLSSNSSPTALEGLPRETYPRDRIAQRAYELYLERGAADGADFDDWLAAEREIGSDTADRGDAGE